MSRASVRRYLVAYDVTDDRRRARIAKALSGFGDRVQYSVFVIDASPVKFNRLKRALDGLLDHKVDSVLMSDLGPLDDAIQRRFEWMGRERTTTSDEASFVV